MGNISAVQFNTDYEKNMNWVLSTPKSEKVWQNEKSDQVPLTLFCPGFELVYFKIITQETKRNMKIVS